MKKFVWRLQKLLDVKTKQEELLRTEIMVVTQKAVSVRGQIMVRKTLLREMLAGLLAKETCERVKEQELFFRYAHVSDEIIRKLQSKLAELEEVRKVKVREIMKIRRFRKGLEKLRAKAQAEFMEEQNRFEQNDMDDKTTTRFARKIMQETKL